MTKMSYRIRVDYRTSTTCNSRTVEVNASSWEEASDLANAKVCKHPAVTKIDGGTLVGQPIPIPEGKVMVVR